MKIPILVTLILAVSLAGCGSTPRYDAPVSEPVDDKSGPAPAHIKDSGPTYEVKVDHIPDAVPMHEMVTLAGNKTPYTVLGKTYHVLFDTHNFSQTGYASWYGKKFHGRKTSNGETYDMYAMSAAHKTLPIPCYVEVVNLENNRKVIVRVNDRGPFHSDRIIDLSYTAAKKLDFHTKGTAKVRVRVINSAPLPDIQPALAAKTGADGAPKRTYLQLGAFSLREGAEQLKLRVGQVTGYPVLIRTEAARNLYKVYVGPLLDNFDLLTLRQKLLDAKLAEAHVVEM